MLIGLTLTGCTVFGIRTYEEAPYSVLKEKGNIQIRQYRDLFVAQTVVTGNYDETGPIAFDRLAGFINGNNKEKQGIPMTTPVLREKTGKKISMTAPVFQEKHGSAWTMSFVMPSQYTLETLPDPLDKDIHIKRIPGKKVATIRYSGPLTKKSITENTEKLLSWLRANGYNPLSPPRSAGYDPPWTISFLRRNEIHVDIQ